MAEDFKSFSAIFLSSTHLSPSIYISCLFLCCCLFLMSMQHPVSWFRCMWMWGWIFNCNVQVWSKMATNYMNTIHLSIQSITIQQPSMQEITDFQLTEICAFKVTIFFWKMEWHPKCLYTPISGAIDWPVQCPVLIPVKHISHFISLHPTNWCCNCGLGYDHPRDHLQFYED